MTCKHKKLTTCPGVVGAALSIGITLFMPIKVSGVSDDSRIGLWDGKTDTAALSGPYVDPAQAQVPFGRRSFYLTPWRSYMDTWTGAQVLDCLGINFNVDEKEADATAAVLAEAGIRDARVEIGWGNCDFDDPTKLQEGARRRFSTILQALKRNRIRPLILLNGNSGAPCPMKALSAKLRAPAEKGARTVYVQSVDGIVPGYTGLTGMAYATAFPLIVSVDPKTGRCDLSAPLTKPLAAGNIPLQTLKYRPFSGLTYADGGPNPAGLETVNGWKSYVAAVCSFARDNLSDTVSGDNGFDLEVWNEYSFGSEYLDVNNYYSPALKFKEPVSYTNRGITRTGVEAILPMTVDYAIDPANGLIGVGVISGFSNQRPWDNGMEAWPGQVGYSRHYYTDLQTKPLSKANDPSPGNGPLSALGQPDGKPDGKDWNTVVPGSYFVPTVNNSMPEFWHYAYKTEFISRDLQPFPGPMKNHYRFGTPVFGRTPQVWMTESNTWRKPWMDSILLAAGCRADDVRAINLSQSVATRAMLRSFVFQGHKGVHTIDMFAAKEDDLGFSFLPSYYYQLLAQDRYQATDRVWAQLGPQWLTLKRLTKLLSVDRKLERPIEVPRPLEVNSLIEHHPRLMFKGDGTLAHPDRFNRDDFAILPFQVSDQRFAVGYYVVTHNLVHDWDTSKNVLDPVRYTMPDQQFDITLGNVRGTAATVSTYDPITDISTPVKVLNATKTTLTVRVMSSDYPRFLMIHETKPGVQLTRPRLRIMPGNQCTITFNTNVPCKAAISYGTLPERKSEKLLPAKMGASAVLTVPLPSSDNIGYKVVAEAEGIKVRWPLWDYDEQGKLPKGVPIKPARAIAPRQ